MILVFFNLLGFCALDHELVAIRGFWSATVSAWIKQEHAALCAENTQIDVHIHLHPINGLAGNGTNASLS
jgi:hypothetical protein